MPRQPISSVFSRNGQIVTLKRRIPKPGAPLILTTVFRRNQTIDVQRNIAKLPDGPVCFIADSTGLKICGQGEWHSRKCGEKRCKRLKKRPVGVDKHGWIVASKVTEGSERDPSQVPDLLGQVDREIDCFEFNRCSCSAEPAHFEESKGGVLGVASQDIT